MLYIIIFIIYVFLISKEKEYKKTLLGMVISVIGSLFITVVSFFAIQVFFVTYSAINGLVIKPQNIIIRNTDNDDDYSKVDIKNTKFFLNEKELSYETPSSDGINTLNISNLKNKKVAIYTSKVNEPTIKIKEIEASKIVLNIKKHPILIFGYKNIKMPSIQKVEIPVSYKFQNENNIKVVLNK